MENINNAENKNSAPEGAAYFRENPTAPVRILVSTATHLVPGDGFLGKTRFIRNLVCQHHWNHDFELGHDRFRSHNAEFGYDNRACYFLIDHGQSPNDNRGAVPILRYRWTGETLVPIHEALPSRIRRRLKKIPFTNPQPVARSEPQQISATQRREYIRAGLRHDMRLPFEDFIFLRKNPEHAKWLENNMEPRFWLKLKSLENEEVKVKNEILGITTRLRLCQILDQMVSMN